MPSLFEGGALWIKFNAIFSKERHGTYFWAFLCLNSPLIKIKGGAFSSTYGLDNIWRFYYIYGQFVVHLRAISHLWPITTFVVSTRVIRIIHDKSQFDAHTNPIFKDLGILEFNDIHLLQLGHFMYSCKNSFLPPRFNNNFSQSNQFHSYNTRNSQAYRLPYCRTNTKKFSPFFQGPKFFNSLDNEVINSQSLSSFKKNWRLNYWGNMKTGHKSFHLFFNWCETALARSSRKPNLS